ncbi:GCN5-related N-acetyltransferase 3, chloroplastic isoform X2 [Magnolia sinica]|uniref:GCN5-related N-acetyltransferase 3, chloroplastic isoform X2 n=1 Tax=Magnolia sinica TaxID=86752 RepID=UPI00265B04EF|nr:GCN5-related N-acetyltransferase 3, chloroplastic isoform X2 [Magnolia sinica]
MAAISSHSLPSISSHLYPSQPQKFRKTLPPIFISTNPSHLNLHQLAHLFASTNFSCHRFPNPDAQTGRVEPVDPGKLRTAVDHSSVVVSVFCREEFCEGGGGKEDLGFGGLLMERAVPVSEKNGRLVGFGRAVSDGGLTAAIYDVVVIPSLQRLGIGRRIVKRIIRLFFEACGFGEDALGSTTMMYTRSASNYAEGNPSVRRVGRMLLLVPPLRKSSSENAASG